ncbi:hypothetical protein GCM10027446_15580 [Angustibacter peucedani]
MSLPPLPDVPRERRRTSTVVAVGALGVLCVLALAFGLKGLFAPADGEPASGGTATGSATPTQDGAAASSATDAAGSTASPSATATAQDAVEFVSPSGNIRCRLTPDEARCDITERDWDPPKTPASCTSTYGSGVYVTPQKSGLVCADDRVEGGDALEYGDSVQRGSIRCDSDEDGVRCVHVPSKHGFSISRGSYRLS